MAERVGVAGATDNATTVNVPWTHYGTSDPIDIAAGDVGILAWNGQSTPTWTPPAGWELAAPEVIGSTGSHRSRIYVRDLDGTEGAAPVTLTADAINKMMGMLYVARGVDAADIIDAIASRDETVTGTSHACPAIETVAEDAPVLTIIHERLTDSSTNYTAPATYTKRLQVAPVGGGGSVSGAIADDGLAVSRPAETTVTPGPWTNGQSTNNVITWTISLTPAAVPVIPSGGGTAPLAFTASGDGTKIGIGGGTASVSFTASGTGEDITPTPATFPYAPLDVRAELYIAGQWVNTIDRALKRDPVTISRGRKDIATRAVPSTARLSLRDQDGKWSNRNPRSPYFGLLGRNTPLRVRVGDAPPYAYMPGATDNYLSTPAAAALDITGDLDIRVDVTPDSWRPDSDTILAARYQISGDHRSWVMHLREPGTLELIWSTDGTTGAREFVSSTAAVPVTSRARRALRATLDADNSAGGHTVTFYVADSLDGPWTQLGDPVTGTGATSVHGGAAPLELGAANGGGVALNGTRRLHGRLHGFQLRDGIGGPVVADPGIVDQTEGATEWDAADGLTWATHGLARLLKPARFHGEVKSWPPAWHVSGGDVRMPIQAAGIRQRLSQGKDPVLSPLRRSIPADPRVVAYWPMEDAGGNFASAFGGYPALRVNRNADDIEYASDDTFVGSAPLPRMRTTRLVGAVPGYPITGQTQVHFLVRMPDEPLGGARQLIEVVTTGTAARWDLWYSVAEAELGITAYDREGTKIVPDTFVALPAQGIAQRLSLELTQTGGNVGWKVATYIPGESGSSEWSGTLTGHTVGQARNVVVGDTADLGDTVIGHVVVLNSIGNIFDSREELLGFAGETAAQRMTRLTEEHGVPLVIVGQLAETAVMGPQPVGSLLELMDGCADADGGILHDSRDELGFEYRTRASLYNQPRRVVLDYTRRGEVPPPLEPVEDDDGVRNDVTVTRTGGSSARSVVEDGPLSVQAPPDGVGPYDEEITLNLASDDQLPGVAAWRTHLGTWDEARYPTITMWAHTAGESNETLVDDIASLDVGDRAAIINPPPWLPPADIDQLAQGYTEVLKPRAWEIVVNASPAGPWQVAVLDGEDRVDTDGSHLAAAVAEDDTSLSVATGWYEDFEDTAFAVEISGTWVRDSSDAHSGAWCLSSGTVAHLGFAATEVTVPAGARTLGFWWRVSSEAGFDKFTVSVDGATPLTASGESGWRYSLLDVAGAKRITLRYDKDVSASAGTDRAYVDELWFDPAPLWTTDAADMPFGVVVGGERCTVTAISGTSSPQTFTVVRAVNGIVKPHTAGADVQLADPPLIAL